MFKGRNLLIATKHKKEKVIAPILEKELGVRCFTTDCFDTDELGTFSGEIDRKDDPITTVRRKCLLAMELNNCDLGLASEGSFGPHPSLFFIPANEEFLIFIDKQHDIEIIAREISTDTNFNEAEIKTKDELDSFIQQAKFPSHGLIIKKAKNEFSDVVKGINNLTKLHETFNHFLNSYGTAYIETDMRAMENPTRMSVIEKATYKLAYKINSLCPECKTPGFGITDAKQGLPCERCNLPTRSTLSHIYTCQKCSFTKEEKYPNNKLKEDPTYCDFCNP